MAGKGMSILVVDDEPVVRQILARIVAREGYSVVEACDGLDALAKMNEQSFDIVISDIKMPNLDGMGLLEQAKDKYPQTLVLLITAFAGEYSSDDVMEAGADSYIAKPFKNVEISKTLETLAQKRTRVAQR